MSQSRSDAVPSNLFNPTIAGILRIKALCLVGRAGLTSQDREDLEQQLALHVLQCRDRFDSSRGTWAAFVRGVVERRGENIVRARRAAKRGRGRIQSLTDEVSDTGGESVDLARTLEAAIESLPTELREVVELLRDETVASAARKLGVSRAKLYAKLREVRERLEFRELEENP